MNNTIFRFNVPKNEEIIPFVPGDPRRIQLKEEMQRMAGETIDIPLIIGGREVRTGNTIPVVMPHNHRCVLAHCHTAGEKEVEMAIAAALEAKESWMNLSWMERASITLKAAELLSRKYRLAVDAATMLGQSKTVFQAEIDAACEAIDFLRYNAYFASQIYSDQPRSDMDQLNRMEYRPLEGFIFAVTPFNFTAIASNLCMAVALMGNTVVWKPASTAVYSNYLLMKVFQEAGMPDGVLNFLPGSGGRIGAHILRHPDLAGIHFTGSNATFNSLWQGVAANLSGYRSYPRIVGETGGKGFVFAHASAQPREVAVALVRGAFEYQGQKCSAVSRAYIPQSLWPMVRELSIGMISEIKMGDVADFTHFMSAVIDEPAHDRIMAYIEAARHASEARILCGGTGDKSTGYFIAPTVIQTDDPHFVTMEEEIFGPVLTIHVYPDERFLETLELCDRTSPYGLTGAVFATDRCALVTACRALRYAAGNFYFNDKPTGAMVGLQPFGGARASGTNDKAGGYLNLLRWVSPRTVKETFVPAADFRYPFMGAE